MNFHIIIINDYKLFNIYDLLNWIFTYTIVNDKFNRSRSYGQTILQVKDVLSEIIMY